MVRFIEDQVLHLGQVKGSVIQMIKQTAGTGDNDLNARPDLFDLWQLADPAVYRYAANSCLPAQLGDVAMNLLCQFTGRGDDEGPDLAARAIEQPAFAMVEVWELCSAYYQPRNDVKKKELLGNISLKIKEGNNYLIKILTSDLNRGTLEETHIFIDKQNNSSSQYFLITEKENDVPVFRNFVTKKVDLKLESEINKEKEIFGRYYFREFPVSPPPFSTTNVVKFKYSPDSTIIYQFNNNGQLFFTAQDSGFVFFQTDTSKRIGKTLYRFPDNYPKVTHANSLVKSIRYISTKNEYSSMLLAENTKLALDKFWLDRTGNKERARELIRKYYSRVEDANRLFTSFHEGWKTDRGMISIIFGPPRVVNKSQDTETWIYGDENNMMTLRFVFYQVNNPFSNNDYKLNRGNGYRTNWYRAVEAWRNGRVYWVQ